MIKRQYLITGAEIMINYQNERMQRLYGNMANYRREMKREERAMAVIPILEAIQFRIARL